MARFTYTRETAGPEQGMKKSGGKMLPFSGRFLTAAGPFDPKIAMAGTKRKAKTTSTTAGGSQDAKKARGEGNDKVSLFLEKLAQSLAPTLGNASQLKVWTVCIRITLYKGVNCTASIVLFLKRSAPCAATPSSQPLPPCAPLASPHTGRFPPRVPEPGRGPS
jgi:hypothetical protein